MKKYIVREGDTMWAISKRTGVRVNLLMAANPQITDPHALTPGQTVMIPELTKKHAPGKPQQAPAPGHQAKSGPGDTGVPLPTTHHGYQTPQSAEPMPAYFGFVWPHVVGPNETWNSIASKYGLSEQQLQHLNPTETPTTLQEGDVLYIPALGPTGPSGQHAMPGQKAPGQQPPYSQQMPMPEAIPATQPMPPYYGRPEGYAGYGYGHGYGYPAAPPYPYPGSPEMYMRSEGGGLDEDDWEWQSWGWTDVPLTSYVLPKRQHRSDDAGRE